VNNTIHVFEEAFTDLSGITNAQPLVKLNKETGEPCTRSRSPCQTMAWCGTDRPAQSAKN
jgi:hypothetical protein